MDDNPSDVVQVILVRKDGSLILQLRDKKDGLVNSGLITAFGGSIKPGETSREAAIREISEETNLAIVPKRLEFFKKYTKTKNVHGEDKIVDYFITRNIDDKNLKIYEGQGFIVLDQNGKIDTAKVSVLMKEVIEDYKKAYIQ